MDKKSLRKLFIAERKQMDAAEHRMLNHLVLEGVRRVLSEQPIKKLGIYYPFLNEVDLRDLKKDYAVYYPKIENDEIVFYEDRGTFEKSSFGVWEPKGGIPIDKAVLDAVLVPGLVYDDGLYRLGYGKGYYDAFLKDFPGLKIGVCFERFRMEALPNKPHDIPVDILVTDNQIYENVHNEL